MFPGPCSPSRLIRLIYAQVVRIKGTRSMNPNTCILIQAEERIEHQQSSCTNLLNVQVKIKPNKNPRMPSSQCLHEESLEPWKVRAQ